MKRGQVTIFVIAAIIIVALILMFLFLKTTPKPDITEKPEVNINNYLEICLDEKMRETINLILSQGGYVEPKFAFDFKFENEPVKKISYLCYIENYYLPCINQEPVLLNKINNEIRKNIEEDVWGCFDSFTRDLSNQGYTVTVNSVGRKFNISLVPNRIVIDIYNDLTLTRQNETTRHKEFKTTFTTNLYDLAVVAQEIVSQESVYCNFNALGFMIYYRDFDIDKYRTGDSKIIYTIKHKNTNEKFRFAVRTCVIPPGF